MTPEEAIRLLAHAAAFDNRQPSRVAAQAWAAALHDVPLDQDTLDAVARFYGEAAPGTDRFDPTRRRWLEPHHVRHHRRQIRAARIDSANTVYNGDPDETWQQAIQNQRQLTRAAADGHITPRPVQAAIESGQGVAADGKAQAILKTIGRESPSRRPEFAAPCPHCGATTAAPCRTSAGKRRRNAHPTRIDASNRLRSGQKPTGRNDIERELDRRRAAAAAGLAQLPDDERARLAEFQQELRDTEAQKRLREGEAS